MKNIKDLDCIMRDKDWVLFNEGKPLTTPAGNEVSHPDGRILKHILIKLIVSGNAGIEVLNSFTLFAFQKDYLEKGRDPLGDILDTLIRNDILVNLKTGKHTQNNIDNISEALDFLENNNVLINLLYTGVSEMGTRINNFLYSDNSLANGTELTEERIIDYIKNRYFELNQEEKAAVSVLYLYHHGGILLPLMLVKGYIATSEYSNVLMALHLKYMRQKNENVSSLADLPFHTDGIVFRMDAPEKSFRRIHEESLRIMEFLSFFHDPNDKGKGMLQMIRGGENNKVEFKTSFRWDVYQNKKNPAIEHASLKTVAAFLNSDGGDLLIGVEDDGNIQGIEIDRFDNDDKFLLHFWNLVKSSLGQESTPFINTFLEKFDGKTVCRVTCKPSPFPVFLEQKGFDEEFYIRTGPGSTSLKIRETMNYISERFSNKFH